MCWCMFSTLTRPDPHPRGAAQPDSALQEQEEEILGSDDEEQEDPNDYCKGKMSNIGYTWKQSEIWCVSRFLFFIFNANIIKYFT